MATPHVAGLAAYLLTLDSSLTPSSVSDTMRSKALKGVISSIRKFINPAIPVSTRNSLSPGTAAGTTNALINNGL